MRIFENQLWKIEKIGSYAKININFYTNWCEWSKKMALEVFFSTNAKEWLMSNYIKCKKIVGGKY